MRTRLVASIDMEEIPQSRNIKDGNYEEKKKANGNNIGDNRQNNADNSFNL